LRVHEINADWGSRIKKTFFWLFFRYAKGLNFATAPLLAPSTARTTHLKLSDDPPVIYSIH